MKTAYAILSTALAAVLVSGCTTYYSAQSTYSDDLYASHDKQKIANAAANQQQQAYQRAQIEAAERQQRENEINQAIAEALAKYNIQTEQVTIVTDPVNPYDEVLSDSYEESYERRLKGFSSPTYKMPSSYYNFRYSSASNYVSAYDPAFYNVIVMGDQVWVEPKYVTAMFGSWGGSSVVNFNINWGGYWGWGSGYYGSPYWYGWNRPWYRYSYPYYDYYGWGYGNWGYYGWGYPYYYGHNHHGGHGGNAGWYDSHGHPYGTSGIRGGHSSGNTYRSARSGTSINDYRRSQGAYGTNTGTSRGGSNNTSGGSTVSRRPNRESSGSSGSSTGSGWGRSNSGSSSRSSSSGSSSSNSDRSSSDRSSSSSSSGWGSSSSSGSSSSGTSSGSSSSGGSSSGGGGRSRR